MAFRFRNRGVEDLGAQQNFEQLERRMDNPVCILRRAATQSVSNGNHEPVSWDTEDYDPTDMHSLSVNASRITIKEPGAYMVVGQVGWAGGYPRQMTGIWVNGTSNTRGWRMDVSAATAFPVTQAHALIRLEAGDFLDLVVWQNSGGSVNIGGGTAEDAPRFAACLVSRT